jgi:hypothetical protein
MVTPNGRGGLAGAGAGVDAWASTRASRINGMRSTTPQANERRA